MAEIDLIKISELPATSTIGDADELAVVQGGATKKVPYSVLKAGAEVTPDTTLTEAGVPADAAAVGAALALKANQAAVTQALAAKADKTEVTDISGDIVELASVVETKADQTALNQKADKTTTDALRQDLTTLNGIVSQKADKTELNTQIGNVTAELATKANTADVNNLLAAKANVASPVFTGRPQAPTAAKGTATLQLATTAFVQNAIDDKQDTLTFDSKPTEESTNPVTSGGVWESVTDLTNSVNNISDDLSAYKNLVGNPLTQYLNASSWLVNHYWNGSLAATSANGYECIKAEGLKAGTYHFNRMSAPFTWFENVATGEVKRASRDYGLSDITEETEVTIAYDFNLYLTITGSHIYYKVMVTDGDMLESYLTTAGVYSFNLSEAFRTSVKKPIYCGSTREYTTLKSAIEEATKYMDSVVYVDAETFDLVDEFGSEWLENYSEEANCGLFLKNRVHIIFASGAKVVFNYTGSNEYIQRRFSPFNAVEHGFTLENAYVESTNCRYSVHEERGTAEDAYHNIYKRCTFIHDSTGTTWGSHQCIGGGLGKNGDVLIEDCYMQTAGTAATVSYHNSAAANAESKVVLKDSYLSSTALISNYGTSTKKTKMIVTNCSLKSDPIISTESQYADNVELVKWNNVIRS